jgi:osomolarity two-component system, sensor histidine kinase NIK1
VARGDPTQKITGVSVSGDTINDMIEQLAIIAAEVKKVQGEAGTEGKLGVQAAASRDVERKVAIYLCL